MEKLRKTGEHILVENAYQQEIEDYGDEPEEYNIQMMSERVSEPQRYTSSKKKSIKRAPSTGVIPMRSKAKPETLNDMVAKAFQT